MKPKFWRSETMTSIEKHHFKITIAVAVSVILFIIYTTYSIAIWQAHVQSEINTIRTGQQHIVNQDDDILNRISLLENKATNSDVQFATINTKLANIESLLVDIKVDLKQMR